MLLYNKCLLSNMQGTVLSYSDIVVNKYDRIFCLLDWSQSTQNKHFIWTCLWGVFRWIGGFSKFSSPMQVGIIEGLGRTRGRGKRNLPLLLPSCLIEWRDFFSSFMALGLEFKSLVFSFVKCLSKFFTFLLGYFIDL